jgi:hypothetical protein
VKTKKGEIMKEIKKRNRLKIYEKKVLFPVTTDVFMEMAKIKDEEKFNWSNYLRECVEQKLKSIEVATNK